MFREIRAVRTQALLTMAVLVLISTAQGAVIGQWSGSNSGAVWASSGNFSSIYAGVTSGPTPHTVESPEAITVANLANNTHFIVAAPSGGMTSTEISILLDWVKNGHVLLIFTDPFAGSAERLNQILTGFGTGASGSPMQIDQYSTVGVPGMHSIGGSLVGPDIAVTGPPSLVGAPLSYFGALQVMGGNALAAPTFDNFGNALRVDTFQLGRVYVFGERFDSNGNYGTSSNRQFFFNLLNEFPGGGGGEPGSAPEPATIVTVALALVALKTFKRSR